ncbi:MAG: NUDIX hydrolase [Cypionkella sp.]|uniref:NUDIX hydrolase n=1 Tax=Cypionkella sp. TaxID=2811411 RepID=UPI002AB9404E|nr:NUDIX hydrolase [Cypionkella sp.]MDZ4312584.1 NUDIX hydrolase [Cypionkella sp.]MDZ4393214.1 NUDIX hydrolase [Cypionkella sp.]
MNQTLPIAPLDEAAVCPEQYGAICWRMHRGKVEVLLITSRDTGRWVIPKGWPMDKRSPAEAAQQEAWEEAGVRGDIAETSIGRFNYVKLLTPKRSCECVVKVFALRVSELVDKFPERNERRRKWFAAEKAARKVLEPELRQVLLGLSANFAIEPPELVVEQALATA